MKFSCLTILPKLLESLCSEGLLAKAVQKKLISLDIVNIRDFSEPPHHRVDEKPYGGGAGMVMTCEPIVKALRTSIAGSRKKSRVILLSAKGKKFTQRTAKRWLKYDQLVFICGRYEGIDERIKDFYADEEIRIGDYVLMGGEVAAAVMIEAVGRLVPGVLGNPESIVSESFSESMELEHAQYTRPPEFEGHKVPEVLLGGNHAKIKVWRSERATSKKPRVSGAAR